MKDKISKVHLVWLGSIFLVVLLALLVFDFLRRGIFDKSGINVVVCGENTVGLLLLRPEEKMVNWVQLPNDLKIKIHKSTATYPVASLWELGVSEKNPYRVVEDSLGGSMGVVISRTIRIDDGEANIENVLGKLLSLYTKTDISWKDRWLIRQFLAESVSSKKVLELDIPDTAFNKEIEPDGQAVRSFNSVMMLWTKNRFYLENILNENVDVVINNTSGIQGAGSTLSKQLESSGMRIIDVKADMGESQKGRGCVYYSNGSFTASEAFLQDQVGCDKILMVKPENESLKGKGIYIWLN